MATHTITLDVKKRLGAIPPCVVVRQGDTNSQTIVANIVSDGVAHTSTCSSVRLDILHADNTWAEVAASKSGSTVTCTLPSAALNSHGLCKLAHFVFFTGNTVVESTEGFELRILPAVTPKDDEGKAENYENIFAELLEKWQNLETKAEKNETTRETEWTALKTEVKTEVKNTIDEIDDVYLPRDEAASTYLTQTNASDTYLKKIDGIRNIGVNPTGDTTNDTQEWWSAKGTCYCFFSKTGQLNGQPHQWGFLLNLVNDREVHQEFWMQPGVGNNSRHWYRSWNSSNQKTAPWASCGLDAYPVGAVYISYVSTSPATLFGGTWVQITGRFLRMANDVNTGGSDTVTLTTEQIPSHSHDVQLYNKATGVTGYANTKQGGSLSAATVGSDGTIDSYLEGITTATGGGKAHNNMPAYQDLYAWRRTA